MTLMDGSEKKETLISVMKICASTAFFPRNQISKCTVALTIFQSTNLLVKYSHENTDLHMWNVCTSGCLCSIKIGLHIFRIGALVLCFSILITLVNVSTNATMLSIHAGQRFISGCVCIHCTISSQTIIPLVLIVLCGMIKLHIGSFT